MQWYRFYVLFMVILFSVTTHVRRILHERITGKSPVAVAKGQEGFARYRDTLPHVIFVIILGVAILYCILPTADNYFLLFKSLSRQFFKPLGAVIILIGYTFVLTAYFHMGHSWRIGIDPETDAELVTRGIFLLSRNPVYLGIDLYFVGMFMIFPNTLFAALLVITVFGLHIEIIKEERFLRQRYDTAYEDYMSRTARYLDIANIPKRLLKS
jgi:protein-S-isoprenylcysteine O-methyltransferase Ste14